LAFGFVNLPISLSIVKRVLARWHCWRKNNRAWYYLTNSYAAWSEGRLHNFPPPLLEERILQLYFLSESATNAIKILIADGKALYLFR